MGILRSVCIGKEAKGRSINIHQATVVANGISGDRHCRPGEKQISILPYERIKEYFEGRNEPVVFGAFGENLDAEELPWDDLVIGDRLYCEDVILQITRIGSRWEGMDTFQGERVCHPMEEYFIFCRVLHEGILTEGESILKG